MNDGTPGRSALQAVMFDMDGLLVDTEPLWFEVETEIMARLGGAWSHADQAKLLGGSLTKSVGYLLAKAALAPPPAVQPAATGSPSGWPPSARTVGAWLVEGMVARIAERGVPLLPGAAELLADVVAQRLPCALVTSSERPVMDAVLASIGAAGATFDVTVCAADVSRSKPDPQPYLLAARRLGADPARCAVLEDSPNGVAAARAAGCLAVAGPSAAATTAPGHGGEPGAIAGAHVFNSRGDAPSGNCALVVSSLRDVSVAWLCEQAAARLPSAPC